MKQAALLYFTETYMTLVALILFFAAFAFMIFRVYFYERQETIDQLSRIPLSEQEATDV